MNNDQLTIGNDQLPEGYKQTAIGLIPEDWKVAQLKDLVDPERKITYGIVVPGSNVPNGVPMIRAQDYSRGWVDLEDLYHVSATIDKSYKRSKVVTADILLTIVGSVGNLAKVPSLFSGSNLTQQTARLAFNTKIADADFYLNILRSRFGQKEISNYTKSGVQPSLNLSDVDKFLLPYPSLPEQRSISQALSDVDRLIAALDRAIDKKRAIKTATMQQLLTGKKRLPGFGEGKGYQQTEVGVIPKDWCIKPLKTVSSMSGRIGWQGLKQEEFTFNDIDPFLITGMNFKDGKIRWEEVYHILERRYQEAKNIQLKDGDILMTKDGTIGKLLYVEDIPFPRKASLNSHLLVFRPLNSYYDPKFLFYQLSSKQFADYVDLNKSGSTFFGITQEAVGNYNAYLPSIEEQCAIATVLSDMDAEIAALETLLAKTQALKQGMMQALLTGRVRLV